MKAQEIAAEILRQLGGRKFIAMTGAKKFKYHYYEKEGIVELSFRIGNNAARVNTVRVHYVYSSDTYNMYFNYEAVTKDFTIIKQTIALYDDVYCDMLQDLFTSVTGMYTSLI
jgi:hypothetical protein